MGTLLTLNIYHIILMKVFLQDFCTSFMRCDENCTERKNVRVCTSFVTCMKVEGDKLVWKILRSTFNK